MRFRALRSATVAADGSRRLLKKAGENFIKSARNFIGARYEKKEITADFLFLYLLIDAVDMRLEAIYYHIESDGIFSALLHDDISHSLARLHIEVMHRLDGGCILREHRFKCAVARFHIAPYSAYETDIGIRIDEYFNIHKITKPYIGKNQDSLDKYYRTGRDIHRFTASVMDSIVINGTFDSFAVFELFDILNHQIRFKRIGMVKIYFRAFLIREVFISPVIIVMMNNGDIIAEMLDYLVGERRFAASAAACYSDNDYIMHFSALLSKNKLWFACLFIRKFKRGKEFFLCIGKKCLV